MIEMTVSKMPDEEDRPEVKHAREVDALAQQCSICKLGGKIGAKSGCEIRKKLVIDRSVVGWKHKHLFLHTDGHCRMFQLKEKKRL